MAQSTVEMMISGACVGCQHRDPRDIETFINYHTDNMDDDSDDVLRHMSLVTDTNNSYNPNAIKVMFMEEHHLGFIPEDKLEKFHKFMDAVEEVMEFAIEKPDVVWTLNEARFDDENGADLKWFEFTITLSVEIDDDE
jgi:hypothetical protein